MNNQIVSRIGIFLLFRFLHLLFLFESDIYALVLRLFDSSKKNEEVEVFNIFARFRLDSTDATRESDFLSFHEKSTIFEEICEEGWFIYNITSNYVYLVRVPSIDPEFYESSISVENCSKMSNYLFENAERLARIDMETFERAAKSLGKFQGPVVMMYSTPCSGGTVAAKLLQACDNSKMSLLVLGEPPFLTSLSLLYNSMSIEKLRSLCRSTIRFSVQHQKQNQTIVMKTRSSCTKIVPFIHSRCPSIQHIFIGKHNYENVISRLVISTSSEFAVFSWICWLLNNSKYLVDSVTSWKGLEEELVTRVGPNTDVEFAMAQVYGCLVNFRRNQQFFSSEMIMVDDLISDTVPNIRPLLNICQVSDLAIPECIEWKRSAEDILQSVFQTVKLTEEDASRVEHLVDLINRDLYMPSPL
ncbi:unnamed protein product [Caenorhabditis angaria]|uniref:Uncharacterized protein n=1 Tax=Caenorhabditis angaria TaxID=860376 RepID=A0A9P1ISP2_9PELO|nr:unnamed protein product [Caenorhabditis angaria]